MPLRFLKPLFELGYLFHQYVIWSGSPLPGLFQGFFAESKGFVSLSFWLPSLLNLRHSVVLRVMNGLPTALQLVGTSLLGGPLLGPSPICSLSLPGYLLTCQFGSRCDLGHVGSGCFLFVYSTQVGGVTRFDKMVQKWVPSLCVRDFPKLCNCNNQ